jgi:hypothetical protein
MRAEYMLCVKMLKFTLVKMSVMSCVSVCVSFGVVVITRPSLLQETGQFEI